MSISSISAANTAMMRPALQVQGELATDRSREAARQERQPPAITRAAATVKASEQAHHVAKGVPFTDAAKSLASSLTTAHEPAVNDIAPDLNPPAVDLPKPPATDEPQPAGSKPMMTVKGLLAAWGQSDSPYDINGDGTVDISDLLMLLGNGGTMPMPEGYTEPLSVNGLMAAWGTDNPTFDLNGDGVVDVSDLLLLLGRMGESNGGSQAAGQLAEADLPPGLTAEGLLSMARVDPAANDANLRALMAALSEEKKA